MLPRDSLTTVIQVWCATATSLFLWSHFRSFYILHLLSSLCHLVVVLQPAPAFFCPSATMACLPSFIELMASLGLADKASPTPARNRSSSESSSASSFTRDDDFVSPDRSAVRRRKSSLVSAHYERPLFGQYLDPNLPRVSRHIQGRYSPYSTARVRKPALI